MSSCLIHLPGPFSSSGWCCCFTAYAGDVNYDIAAHISPATSLVVLTDAQGNQAVVTNGGKKFGNIIFYDVSAVLMSGAL
jgi:hypothetical protein